MPLIPLLPTSTAPLTDAPATVFDRERRPTVDTRGVQQAMLRYNEASKMPLMDPAVGAAPYEALGSVGRALTHTGDMLVTLAIKKQEGTDKRLIHTAQSAMDQATTDFQVWQAQNPNSPEQWPTEAQRRAQETIQPYLEMKELSSSGKADLQLISQAWSKQFLGGVDLAATKQTFGLTKQSYLNRSRSAFAKGDRVSGNASLNEAVSGGYLAQPEAEAYRMDGQMQATMVQLEQLQAESDRLLAMQDVKGAKKLWEEAPIPTDLTQPKFETARKSALTDIDYRHAVAEDLRAVSFLADTDPVQGIAQLQDPQQFTYLDPAVRADELSKMRVAREAAAQDEMVAAKRAIDLLPADKLASATVESLGVTMKQATPWHRAMIADSLKAKQGSVNYEERSLQLLAAAGSFASSGNPDLDLMAAARIELAAASLPQADRDKVMQRLKDAQAGTADLAITGLAIADATRYALEENAFAQVVRLKEGQSGEKTLQEQSLFGIDWLWPDKEIDAVPIREIDPEAQKLSVGKLKTAIQRLEQEARSLKGKDWTTDEARTRMMEIMVDLGAKIPPRPAPTPLLPSLDAQPTDLTKQALKVLNYAVPGT
ncbi:hypothetical protein SAMN02745166_05009 [Prosthecobacter debontii]|uniref:Uncharacterized protein n=1 Tax=Prosthecobacter debontii TaxID=48467 RepID=A0A1T4Z453_9BACT|nr:hypothetical protein [Prosthecobacter debontii]SKB08726.1 hypothetical protein SAMN02745166_05009 [Prosthecobacter debontii]